MLISENTSIKTTITAFLLMIGMMHLFATDSIQTVSKVNTIQLHTFSISKDTILNRDTVRKIEDNQMQAIQIPEKLAKEIINFRINSDISYLKLSQFVKNKSKLIFAQAWKKEIVLSKLRLQSDSLRKAYTNSSDEQKENIAAKILDLEKQTILLNEEIPDLYNKARDEENKYWQETTPENIIRFQEKRKFFSDSLQNASNIRNSTSSINQKVPDIITFYNTVEKPDDNKASSPEIVYKIIVGSFKGKIPASAARSIKKLSLIRKVENYKDEKGVKIYTTGNLKNFEEARILLNQIKHEGIKNATISAYRGGKIIDLNEAEN